MANKKGFIDKDLGLEDIFKEMDELKTLSAKVGLPEGSGKNEGVDIATYAAYNELGVMKKGGGGWYIPPRPFIRTTVDSKRGKIQEAIDKQVGMVVDGKQTAKDAITRAAEAVIGLIKQTIIQGPWKENSEVTINGTTSVVVGKETKISKKTGKTYTKTIKTQFIKGKKSSKPLIDTGTMKNNIQALILKNGNPFSRTKGK